MRRLLVVGLLLAIAALWLTRIPARGDFATDLLPALPPAWPGLSAFPRRTTGGSRRHRAATVLPSASAKVSS